MIDSAQYAHYPDTGAMTSDSKCNIANIITKDGSLKPTDLTSMFGAVDNIFDETQEKTDEYREQTEIKPIVQIPQGGVSEGFVPGDARKQKTANFYTDISNNYGQAMQGVQTSLKNIANAEYQRERLLAMTEESNKNLISESYKFILWSILAILAVLALLKLKEMFGQDEIVPDSGEGIGGGLLATILGWFGVGSVKTDDIPDRTEDVKAALTSAGEQVKEASNNLATGITEGADNLVNSANEAATGAIQGANNLVDKAKEAASEAIDKIGAAATPSTTPAATTAPATTTGGKSRVIKKSHHGKK
jgi:F0F1-type ATP synthase membrane subunit b/b'